MKRDAFVASASLHGGNPWRRRPHWIAAWSLAVVFVGLPFVSTARAQLGPISPPPSWEKVPQGTGACSVGKSCADLAPGMIRSAEGSSPLTKNLRDLAQKIGGRVTGSPAARRAVRWAIAALRQAGVDKVWTEKFTVPEGWSAGRTRVEVLTPVRFAMRAASAGWSPPIRRGGITSEVVDVGDGSPDSFEKEGRAVRGSIILVHTEAPVTHAALVSEYEAASGIITRARNAGAIAIFWMSTNPRRLVFGHLATPDGRLGAIPQAIVARADAERVARLLAGGKKVRVHFAMANHVSGPFESENVVAEIRGYDKPDEFVLLGAPLDSWKHGGSSWDGACDAAVVVDAARVIHASGSLPRRSIRFVLFTGEEQGMLGSWAYARSHRAELDHMVAAVVFDDGAGRVSGYSLGGRKDARAAVQFALQPLKSLGADNFTTGAFAATDSFDFLLEGVPTLVADQQYAKGPEGGHARAAGSAIPDVAQLKHNAATAAITVYAIADAATRVAPRLARAQIMQLIQSTGLEKQMKSMGFWTDWQAGTRGRQP